MRSVDSHVVHQPLLSLWRLTPCIYMLLKISVYSCGQRILSLQDQDGSRLNKVDACVQVAEQFPDQCGSCNTNTCPDGAPLHCGCDDCSNEIWASQAGKFT